MRLPRMRFFITASEAVGTKAVIYNNYEVVPKNPGKFWFSMDQSRSQTVPIDKVEEITFFTGTVVYG